MTVMKSWSNSGWQTQAPSAECTCAVAAYEMIMRVLQHRRTRISVPCPVQGGRLGLRGP